MSRFLSSFPKSIAVVVLAASLSSCPAAAFAETNEQMAEELREMRRTLNEFQFTIQQQNELIQKQQGRIDDLERKVTAPPVAPVREAVPPAAAQPPVSLGRGLKQFTPDIGMVADITALLNQDGADAEGNDKISVRELELVVGHDVDPYSRFDSTITFSDFEEVSVEEAYITHWGLPWEMKGKLGRMRPKIGKASAIHRDQLETVDEPLVVQRYLGVEGLFRTGLELSRFLPTLYGPLTQEVTLGVMEGGIGEDGTLFGGTRRIPSFYAHLKNFFEVSDTTNAELGATYLVGSSDADAAFEVNAFGVDATLIHHFTPVNRLKWQSEAYIQDRKEFFDVTEDSTTFEEVRTDRGRHPIGLYSLVDYRLSPRFSVGMRGDYVQPVNADVANPRGADTGLSAFLTFHQSEFARWRFQYSHNEKAEGGNDDLFMLQGTVAIGVHKHQLQ